jgi:short-subunit dehydrogenase
VPRRDINGSVVVITGASSGIGHATALEFARRHCKVVLVGRSAKSLDKVAAEVTAAGGEALIAPADVSNFEQIDRAAAEAAGKFGRIDVWINNAAVAEWCAIEDDSPDDMRRVIDVTLLGTMHGVRAVLPHFRKAGRGTLINVASVVGERAVPLLSSYCAAKAGVRAFTESLRMEMKASRSNVDVVSILPSSINTPFYSWGPSHLGVRPHPLSVIYPPQAVARAIVKAAERPQRDVYVGVMGKLLSIGQRLSPSAIDFYMLQNRRMFKQQYGDTLDHGESNLYKSPEETGVDGMYSEETRRTSFYTDVMENHPLLRRIFGVGLFVTGALLVKRTILAGGVKRASAGTGSRRRR